MDFVGCGDLRTVILLFYVSLSFRHTSSHFNQIINQTKSCNIDNEVILHPSCWYLSVRMFNQTHVVIKVFCRAVFIFSGFFQIQISACLLVPQNRNKSFGMFLQMAAQIDFPELGRNF